MGGGDYEIPASNGVREEKYLFPFILVDSQLGLCNTRQVNKRKALKLSIVPHPPVTYPLFLSVKLGSPFLAYSFSSLHYLDPAFIPYQLLASVPDFPWLTKLFKSLLGRLQRSHALPCPLSPHRLAWLLLPMALPRLPHFLKLSPHPSDSSLWRIFSSPNASVAPKC